MQQGKLIISTAESLARRHPEHGHARDQARWHNHSHDDSREPYPDRD